MAALLALLIVALDPSFDPPYVPADGQGLAIRLSSTRVANGHTLLLEAAPRDETRVLRHVTAGMDGAKLRLYPHPVKPPGTYFALIGIPYFAALRPDTIRVGWTEDGLAYDRAVPFEIVRGAYKSEEIRGVPQNRVAPSPGDLRRIARERKEIARAYVSVRDSLLMPGPFRFPVEHETVTSEYGTRRLFNRQLRSYHGGVDLRAYEGTPIYAAQAGLVRLAENLFYNGNHVILEHGMGVFSTYSHMSRLLVKPGQVVKKGQILGLSGATGRVNAAHLHWTVKVHGVGVSPLQFSEVLDALYRQRGRTTDDKEGIRRESSR